LKLIYGSRQGGPINEDLMFVTKNDLYAPSEISAQKKTNEILSEIEKKTVGGKKLFELFAYDDVSLWWFIFPTIYLSVKEAVSFIDSFQEVLKGKNPKEIKVTADFGKLPLIEQVGKKYNIKVSYSILPYVKFQLVKWLTRQVQPSRFKRITQKKTQSRIGTLKNDKRTIPSIKGKVVFAVATAYRRKIFDAETGDSKFGEFLIGPVIDIVKKLKHEIVGIDLDYTFKGQIEPLLQRLGDDFPWFPIEVLIENFQNEHNEKSFLKNYNQLITSPELQSIFTHDEIYFWGQVEGDFLSLGYFPYLPTYMRLIDSCKKYFKENRPTAVFLPYEAGPIALPIIIACQQNKIHTIGFQHGLIYGINPDYSHHNFRLKNDPLGMPLPDNLLLFGNYAKNKLEEMKTYPQEKLIVFGHPMYFNIGKIVSILGSKDVKEKYNIPKDKKIILFTTGRFQRHYHGFETRNHDEKILEKLLQEFGGKEEYFVVLKPHPTEEYVEYYKKLISDYNSKNFVIIQSDLFELLYMADVVVCYFSTILLDSIAFGKCAIEVDFGEKISTIPFKEYNVILNSDLNSLKQNIEKLLYDDALRDNLKKNMANFIKEHFNIPNNSAEDQIKSLIKN
jgi:glycosyltransferase involved in cell wall biosynthesis